MPTVTELTLYPIKSCAGIALQEAMLMSTGLSHASVSDRQWMVVGLDGLFLTQREHPHMASIRPAIIDKALVLTAPGATALEIPLQPEVTNSNMQVQVWDDMLTALDCGNNAAAWFSQVIGVPCRLVRFHPDVTRLASKKWTADRDVPTHFADGFPILLISTASLDDLNQKLQQQARSPLPMNRFRPNIVIDGLEAFEEDYVSSFDKGPLQLKPVKPCSRCTIPSVDQLTGEVGPDPVDILQGYRANPLVNDGITFGMNVIVTEGAGQMLRVGDELSCELAF